MVLLIDDDPSVRDRHRRMLASLGYAVSAPTTEHGWLSAFRGSLLELIIVDYGRRAGALTGVDIVRALRQVAGPQRRVPIIGFSCRDSSAALAAAGADFVLEPTLPEEHCALVVRVAMARPGGRRALQH
ncbi:MAG: response regulator [Deltaproteobacteria bacterium]|nr:response regulator [Deltaproteobacteria bacterium]